MQNWTWNKPFYKFHASGNDFIIVFDKENSFIFDELQIQKLCHRKFGVGADGFIIIKPQSVATYRMEYYNLDGKRASFCGNALRCLALCIPMHFGGNLTNHIETDAGCCTISATPDYKQARVELELSTTISTEQELFLYDKRFSFHKVHYGVPHAVFFVKNLEQFPVTRFGTSICHHKIFSPEGVNVNFVEVKSGKFFVRTYERGVEQETLACGSGGAAVSIILSSLKNVSNPIPIIFASKEEVLYFVLSNGINYRVLIIGSASFVFQGMFL